MPDAVSSSFDDKPTLLPPLPRLRIRGRSMLPIVQGGMGVGVSAHRLAGSVAACDGVGTLSSVDLRNHHADLMSDTRDVGVGPVAKDKINAVNLVALDREIKRAKDIAKGMGMIAVNIMRAVAEYASYVRQSCESGADAVVVGAGLPLDLPELTKDHPQVALIPILSDVRGIQLVMKKWERKGRLPDAIVIEHPKYAGGHLGAAKIEDLDDPRFDFENVIPGTRKFFREMGLDEDSIPLIPAGGINTHERVRELINMGAGGVQLGTAFAVTEEGDAHDNFKRVLAGADDEQIVEFMSVAGLPARAVKTPWLENYLKAESTLQSKAAARNAPKPRCVMVFDCLQQCGLRDGISKIGQFCIDRQLAAAVRGDIKKGLFFRGASALPFGKQIRPVRELIEYLMTGVRPAGLAT